MRFHRHALAVALVITAMAGLPAAWGSTAAEYLKIRSRHGPTRVPDPRIVEENLEHFWQKCIEFSGVIGGRLGSGDQDLLMLQVGPSASVRIAVSNNVPQMAIGSKVRVMVRPPEARTDLTYSMVAIGWEGEIAALESKRAEQAVASAPRPRWRAHVEASRGGGPRITAQPEIVAAYANVIRHFNKRLGAGQATAIAEAIIGFSARHGLDARLVMAVVAVESNFNPEATSRTGAMGLGQLMPATARGMGVGNPYDYRQNLDGAVRLIRGHLCQNSGDLALALACYNAGSGAVRRFGGVPPYAETQRYIRKVVSLFLAFAPEYAGQRS